jgi:predicted dinucleotide-binding enzyme
MKITLIGSGRVGAALAGRLVQAGHDVVLAQTREGSDSVQAALTRWPALRAAPLAEAVAHAEVVFLATPYAANEGLIAPLASALAGKVLVDCTNPVGPGLTHGLRSERSGSEAVQALAPEAKVVKAFSIYGYENLEDSAYPGYDTRPAMLYCGDDAAAKAQRRRAHHGLRLRAARRRRPGAGAPPRAHDAAVGPYGAGVWAEPGVGVGGDGAALTII